MENPITIANMLVEIQTENFPNTDQHTNHLTVLVSKIIERYAQGLQNWCK
jgi:hypothetical protein